MSNSALSTQCLELPGEDLSDVGLVVDDQKFFCF